MRQRQKSKRTEVSDQRMIEAAIAIMLERGIGGLRMTDIGLRAGYSRGLATMRFGTLGALLRRVARHLSAQWVQTVTEAIGDRIGIEAILAAIDAQESLLAPSSSGAMARYLLLFHSIDPGAADRLNSPQLFAAQQRDLTRWIREGIAAGDIRRDVDAVAEAELVLASMIGIVFRFLLDPTASPRRESANLKAAIMSRLAKPVPDRTGRSGVPGAGPVKWVQDPTGPDS